MLMHFDAKKHKINQLSIPRDTLVDVPGYGQSKLTEAMWFGGPSLALKAVKQYTGIPINHIMTVSFQGFPRLVNSVGGIDMYVPQTVTTGAGLPTDRVVTFEKGMHHFDGKNAMLYVRIRKAYADGDFTRADPPAGVRPGHPEEARPAGQHLQAAGDRQALHERRGHRPHHQPDPRARLPQVARPPAGPSR